MSKGTYIIVYQQIAQIVLAAIWLRQMDFLYIPRQLWKWTQSPDTRHPGLNRAFQDIHVLKLLDIKRNIKKIPSSFAGQP